MKKVVLAFVLLLHQCLFQVMRMPKIKPQQHQLPRRP